MKTLHTAALLAVFGHAFVVSASLWVSEPFDTTSLDAVTNAPAGGTGWEDNSAWNVSNSLNTVSLAITNNLTFGRLATSGQALRVSNPNQSTGFLQRAIDVTPPARRGSFWTSYLVHYEGPTASGNYQYHWFGWSFRKPSDDTYLFASVALNAGQWDANLYAAADVNGKDLTRAEWPSPPVSGTTYLVITAVTNVFLPQWSGSENTVLRQWVLDSSDFTAVVDSGLLDAATSEAAFAALLNSNSRSAVQESQDGNWGTGNLNADDLWRFSFDLRNYNPPHAVYTLDELRMGASFVDILPLLPPPPGATVVIVR